MNLGLTGACYQDWKNLGATVMFAKIRLRSTTNIIFTTNVVSLPTRKEWLQNCLWIFLFQYLFHRTACMTRFEQSGQFITQVVSSQ